MYAQNPVVNRGRLDQLEGSQTSEEVRLVSSETTEVWEYLEIKKRLVIIKHYSGLALLFSALSIILYILEITFEFQLSNW